jgi:hypothetical protein
MIDFPGQLSELIRSFFCLIGYKVYFGFAFFLFFILASLVFLPIPKGIASKKGAIFLAVLSVFFAWGRLPSLGLPELNPDESFWIILGAKLHEHFLPYIAIDSGTNGPIVPGLLAIFSYLGVPLNYATSRLILLIVCLIPSIVLIFLGIRNLLGYSAAQFGILIPTLMVAFPEYCTDFIVYNGEFMALPVISLVFYLQSLKDFDSKGRLLSAGFLIASGIWIKLQCLPIMFGLGLIVVFKEISFSTSLNIKLIFKRAGWLFLGGMGFAVIVGIYFLFYPQAFENCLFSMVKGNMLYMKDGLSGQSRSLQDRLSVIPSILNLLEMLVLAFIYYMHFVLIISVIVFSFLKKQLPNGSFGWSFLLLGFAFVSVSSPGNLFHHYLLFFILPSAYFMAEIFVFLTSKVNKGLKYLLFMPFLLILGWHLFNTMWNFRLLINQPAYSEANSYSHQELSDYVKGVTLPSDRINIWGWALNIYVESERLPQAMSETFRLVTPSTVQDYYLAQYLASLKENPPKIFIDYVTKDAFVINKPESQGLKCFPIIFNYISENYRVVKVINGKTIYLRKSAN